jgi:copper chaperone NosL
MKKILLLLVALAFAGTNATAEGMVEGKGMNKGMQGQMGKKMPTRFQAVSPDKAVILQKGEGKMFCPECGMMLPMFFKTNHAAEVNGKTEQYCSIHCLTKKMNEGEKLTGIKAVDNTTLKFIDATKAWYVFGSNKPGTMSMTSKYAFAQKADAEKFAQDFGGKVMNFDDTLAAVKSTLEKESAMISKKQAMMAEKGEMMYKKMCKPITKDFKNIAQAKAYLMKEQPCGTIKGKQIQAIGLYLLKRPQ